MTDYNKIITTVNSITPDYQFIPDLNNTIVIDTSENRIGINTITPDENIHVSGGTIKTQDLIVLGDLSVNSFSSDLLPRDDLSYNIGSITKRVNDIFIGSGSVYMDKTRIFRMADYTRHNGGPGNDISALIIDNSGKHLDISDIRHVNIQGDISLNKNLDLSDQLLVHGDVSFMSKLYVKDDTSFNNRVDIKEQLTVLSDVSFMSKLVVIDDSSFNSDIDVSGVLHIKKSLTPDGLITTGTKIYTTYENNSSGNITTRLIIDPSGDGIIGNPARQGEVVIYGNLDVKGSSTFINSTNIDISDNIIRMNANHTSVTDGGIAVINSSGDDKLFTYNNPGNYWTTNDNDINLGPNGGVISSGFMNIDNVNIDGNSISTDTGDLNISSAGGDIYTQNTNLNLGSGVLTVNSVVNAHVPTGSIILWYGNSNNVPAGWAVCNGLNGTPNLQGRFVVCSGTSEHTYSEGQTGGTDDYTLNTQQIPSHNHGSDNTQTTHTHAYVNETIDTGHTHTYVNETIDTSHDHAYVNETVDTGHTHTCVNNSTDTSHDHIGSSGQYSNSHNHGAQMSSVGTSCTVQSSGTKLSVDSHRHGGAPHSHTTTSQQHKHSFDVEFHSSASEDGDGVQALMTDNNRHAKTWLSSVANSVMQTGNAAPTGSTSTTSTSTAQTSWTVGQMTSSMAHDHETSLDLTSLSATIGNKTMAHAHTVTVQSASQNHNHNTQIQNKAQSHLHNIQIQNKEQSHSHDIQIQDKAQSHLHNIQIQNKEQSHSHNIQIQDKAQNHNHVIQNTGGGNTFDNRPKYYSLWYIMKL